MGMKLFFLNQSVGNQMCIDWDMYFTDFLKFALPSTRTLLNEAREIMKTPILAWYQESSNGHVHIGIRFDHNISVLDGFMVRAFLADDQQRLRLDMARYMKTGSLYEMNRCFQDKISIKDGQASLTTAGPWIRLDEPEIPALPVCNPREIICKLVEECEKKKKVKNE
jgi:hypothetical protein